MQTAVAPTQCSSQTHKMMYSTCTSILPPFPGQLMTGTTHYQRNIVITVTALFLESFKPQVHQFPTDHHQLCQPISKIYGKRSFRPLYLLASALSHRVRLPINMFCKWVIMFAYCNHIYSLLYILIISTN